MKLGQRVSLINYNDNNNNDIPLTTGYVVGTAAVVDDSNHITNMLIVEVDYSHAGYMISEDGVKRSFISRIVVHPDNLYAEED